ncbi:matrix metalloproteinase-24-like [Amphibalanus amphitrite]|uniref:matrix metalloproteinase-24-like n=1 Tax=Amphibalanus amphitrite TaxID=1232801 RepID=UPI001C91CF1A|nr:matrix metalloproteinase-24-like [Amphibalanus amphitrite]
MDDTTVAKMRQPRCGTPDHPVSRRRHRRRKRHNLQGSRWRKREIKYKIVSWPSERDHQRTRQELRQAFRAWRDVSAMTFTEVDASSDVKADITIGFEYSDHGDGEPFDGPGGTLAHAFFPIYGGDAHFDKSEPWVIGPTTGEGFDLFTVATHEFGHSLGLAHSNETTALMAPFYQPPSLDRDIVTQDDIEAIQELYGKNPDRLGDDRDRAADDHQGGEADPALCREGSLDALFTVTVRGRSRTYLFRGASYWRLADDGVMAGYPRDIADRWGGVPAYLDAVLVYSPRPAAADTLFFFKGSQVWRMTEMPIVDTGYPKRISEEFNGIPNKIDAAFTWRKNHKIYFFKGSQYWMFDYELAKAGIRGVRDVYPKSIDTWGGMPDDIDAVNTWKDGRTYFFKGDDYYKISDANIQVYPDYPRRTGPDWFGCPGTEDSTEETTTSGVRY